MDRIITGIALVGLSFTSGEMPEIQIPRDTQTYSTTFNSLQECRLTVFKLHKQGSTHWQCKPDG